MSFGEPEVSQLEKTEEKRNVDPRRWELYSEHRRQVWQDIQNSTNNFEQHLLAISSAALGVSLVFVKDIVPLKQAVNLKLLYTSYLFSA